MKVCEQAAEQQPGSELPIQQLNGLMALSQSQPHMSLHSS